MNTETKTEPQTEAHTPGPWRIVESGSTRDIRSCEAAPRTIAALFRPFPYLMGEQENEANARLIAAAPDLLAACEAAATIMQEVPESELHPADRNPFTNALIGLRQALEKARGQ